MERFRWKNIIKKVSPNVKFDSLAEGIQTIESNLMSAQEALLRGGTTSGEVYRRFYQPVAVTEGWLTPEEADWARRKRGFFIYPHLGCHLGIEEKLAIKPAKLDLHTGYTLTDSVVVLGILPNTGEKPVSREDIKPVIGRNLTLELIEFLMTRNKEWELRLRLENYRGGVERST